MLAFVAMPIGWLWGGHSERFGATALLLCWVVFGPLMWRIGDVYVDSAMEDTILLLIFGGLALRSNRWWPFLAASALALTVLIHVFTIVTDISWDAAVSARVGFGLLTYTALLVGVAERWLAGERPVSDGKLWRRRRPAGVGTRSRSNPAEGAGSSPPSS